MKALPVHHMVLCALSTDAEELYIQQAVVLIEDAMQVSAVTSLSSLNDGGGGEYHPVSPSRSSLGNDDGHRLEHVEIYVGLLMLVTCKKHHNK